MPDPPVPCGPACGCAPISRRGFVAGAGAGLTGILAAPSLARAAVAGPFFHDDLNPNQDPIPADKKLSPAWLAALTARGAPTEYRGSELDLIGMPVGGLCTGQLYLGGDGTLWHWDLFNLPPAHEERDWRGPHYAHPEQPQSPIQQGFAVRWSAAGSAPVLRTLDRHGFPDIRFRGQYPIATVEYRDPAAPLAVTLEAFSPFIPLDADDSGLPATVLEYRVRNLSAAPVTVELAGWLQNAACLSLDQPGAEPGERINHITRVDLPEPGYTQLQGGLPPAAAARLAARPDCGSIALALLGDGAWATAALDPAALPQAAFEPGAESASLPFHRPLVGAVGNRVTLAAGEDALFTFVLAWHFDGVWPETVKHLTGGTALRRHYGTRFATAGDVVRYVTTAFPGLAAATRLWRDTWYDSTLPYWLLDRTLLNVSTAATATCYRFNNNRFYGWEGNYCCPGTCTHVWHYAQALARLFPALERSTREMVDFGLAFHPDSGVIDYRAEADRRLAVDGQAGTILRADREHQMAPDAGFLRHNWPHIKRALQCLMARDVDGDGLLEGEQYNTLDAAWYGEIAWLSSLYIAALHAGAAMADEMGAQTGGAIAPATEDAEFARQVRTLAARGRAHLTERLFNGEYFIQRIDPRHPEAINTNDGCHIDQVFGQSWAFQVGLGRVLPAAQTHSALRALYRHNFTPDVGPYRKEFTLIPGGRWYAMPGEGGLVMCTWPRGGAEHAAGNAVASGNKQVFVGYFNECMTGFEYQVAAHMLWEGMVTEGLTITRMVHDRYHAARRNPWNEVECGDHYARAMASYGVFLAACGFEYHGPRGHLGFAPRLTPEDFRAPFTAAEGWGTLGQARRRGRQRQLIRVQHGSLTLRSLAFELAPEHRPQRLRVRAAGRTLAATFQLEEKRVEIHLASPLKLAAGETLSVLLS